MALIQAAPNHPLIPKIMHVNTQRTHAHTRTHTHTHTNITHIHTSIDTLQTYAFKIKRQTVSNMYRHIRTTFTALSSSYLLLLYFICFLFILFFVVVIIINCYTHLSRSFITYIHTHTHAHTLTPTHTYTHTSHSFVSIRLLRTKSVLHTGDTVFSPINNHTI